MRSGRHHRLVLAIVGLSVSSLAGCASASGSNVSRQASGGTVDVLYAGSLVRVMEQTLGPRFTAESGYSISGVAAGSSELANEIKGGVRRGDVFVSASPQVDAALEGPTNGNWVSWYLTFARAPLVLGYDPRSTFADQLRHRPWYEVITAPGFRIGRTDPVLDPKGQLTVEVLREATVRTRDHALAQIVGDSDTVFPEEALLGRLQTGQLDAGFFYLDEAKAAGVPTVSLAPISLSATFTVTVLAQAPNAPGALAFVKFLVSSSAQKALRAAGFQVLNPPRLSGHGAPAHLLHSASAQ